MTKKNSKSEIHCLEEQLKALNENMIYLINAVHAMRRELMQLPHHSSSDNSNFYDSEEFRAVANANGYQLGPNDRMEPCHGGWVIRRGMRG